MVTHDNDPLEAHPRIHKIRNERLVKAGLLISYLASELEICKCLSEYVMKQKYSGPTSASSRRKVAKLMESTEKGLQTVHLVHRHIKSGISLSYLRILYFPKASIQCHQRYSSFDTPKRYTT